jgi:hypothetical protein
LPQHLVRRRRDIDKLHYPDAPNFLPASEA